MSSRSAATALVLCAWCLALAPRAPAADLQARARAAFGKVMQAQAHGDYAQARALAVGLEHYALYPYFRYADVRHRLHELPQAEVEQFLDDNDDSMLATTLRTAWLRELARAGQWEMFRHFWRDRKSVV